MNEVVKSYQNYREEDRLTTNNARKIEFIITKRVFEEHFPKKGQILDVAAGTGIYSFLLDEKGYDVTALDITPRHIELINKHKNEVGSNINTGVNDASNLKQYEDETFDIVLCMGPLYHIIDTAIREKCINECNRVLKKGGILVVSYINRFSAFPYVSFQDTKYMDISLGKQLVETGVLKSDDELCFWTDTYYHTPQEIEEIFNKLNYKVIDHLSPDGITPFHKNLVDKFSDEEFNTWCEYQYMTCREKSILGAGNHGLILGVK